MIWYIIDLIPIPPPFNIIAKLIIGIILLIYLLDVLLGLGPVTPLLHRP